MIYLGVTKIPFKATLPIQPTIVQIRMHV